MFERAFLTENQSAILRSRRSITRGLGMKVSEETLRRCGLWHRELFYLENETEPPLPTMSFSQLKCNDLPGGWVRASAHWHPREVVRGWSYRLSHEMVKSAWTRSPINDSEAEEKWMRALDEGVSPWGLPSFGKDMGRLLRMSRRQLWRWRVLRGNSDLFGRVRFSKGKGVWRPGTDVPCDFDENDVSSALAGSFCEPGVMSNQDYCPVCLEHVRTWSLPCSHRFCASCQGAWGRNPCPLCRRIRTFPPIEVDGRLGTCNWVDYDEDG